MWALIFPWCFQEVLPASDSNRHLKDIDEEIFDDDDFYHQVGDGKCVLELQAPVGFHYLQRKCSWFSAPYFSLPVKLPVLTPKISASPSGDSALRFCPRTVWVWSCPVGVKLLLVLECVRAAGAVPVVLLGKGSEFSAENSLGRAPLGKTIPGDPQEHWKLLLSQPKSSHLPAERESSWAALALLLELSQLGSRPVIPFICKILRRKESAASAGKHCVCSLFNKDSASFVKNWNCHILRNMSL